MPTVEHAKKEVARLEAYIELVENYTDETLSKKILKLYAYTGNIQKVKAEINSQLLKNGLPTIDSQNVTDVILGNSDDQLQKILKMNYMIKTKGKRSKRLWNNL